MTMAGRLSSFPFGNNMKIKISLAAICLLLCSSGRIAFAADYLNEQEVERVREAQEIDKRAEVFLRIADRRLNVLLGVPAIATAPAAQKEKKEKEKKKDKDKDKDKESKNDYGPEPTGTLSELLDSYSKVMSELLDKLDDAYEKKKDDPLLGKAMSKLLDNGENHLKRLDQLRPKVRSEAEETALEKAMEIAKMAIDGAREFKTQ
jgi:hypothetical protein